MGDLGIWRKIEGLRIARGFKSVNQFAKEMGVNRSSAMYWEQPGFNPDAERLKSLADKFEVRVGYFFDEIPELLEKPYREVLVRESLRSLLLEWDVPETKHRSHPLWRTIEAPDAPVTKAAWKDRAAFLRIYRGEKG